ncbi:MAG: hypothetical protein HYT87_01140 [Nitrospirae bacterium]|nr:hypothetical protein [Nitrospirota bacterium]
MDHGEKSFLPIDRTDLERLAAIAEADRSELFARRPNLAALSGLVLCTALCQGAALHFVNRRNGINDFDVWTFYRAHPNFSFPSRRVVDRDFGNPKFGRSSNRPKYIGRRVDLIGRSIPCLTEDTPVTALRRWLTSRRRSPSFLSEKAVVLLQPANYRSLVAWPLTVEKRSVRS